MTSNSSPTSVVGAFPDPAKAKAAIAMLEGAGVSPRAIRLVGDSEPTTADATLRADVASGKWIGRRAAVGAAVGAVVGVVIGYVAIAIGTGDARLDPEWWLLVFAVAFVGIALGGFIAVARAAPRSSAAWNTYFLAHRRESCVSVRVSEATDMHRIRSTFAAAGAADVREMMEAT